MWSGCTLHLDLYNPLCSFGWNYDQCFQTPPSFSPCPHRDWQTVTYSVYVSVDGIAGTCWEARLVLPQQVGMFVVRPWKNTCSLENDITSGARKVTTSNLVVKEGRGIRPISWDEQVLLMAILILPGAEVLLAAWTYFLLLLAIMRACIVT